MPTGRSSASTTYRRCRRFATSFSSTCARAADPRAWGARDRQRARRAQAQPHGRVGATDQCDALGGVLGPRVQNPCAAWSAGRSTPLPCNSRQRAHSDRAPARTRAAARGVPAGRRRRGRAGRACTNVSRAVASTSTWPTWQPADSRRRSSRLLANMDAGLFCTAARPWASRARDGGHRPACFARGRAPPAASPAGREARGGGEQKGVRGPAARRRACSSARSTPQNSVPCSSARNSPTGSAIAPKCSATIVLRAARAGRPAAAPRARAQAPADA